MDITSPIELTQELNEHLPPSRFFTSQFFGEQVHGTVGVMVDIVKGSTKIAPYGHRGAEATTAYRDGYETKTFNTYPINLKRPTTAIDMLKRMPGEAVTFVGGARNAEAAAVAMMAHDQAELANMVNRAIEKYSIDALVNGTLTVAGETIDFGVKASHKATKTGTATWDGNAAKIVDDLEDWQALIAQDSGLTGTDLVLGKSARKAFLADSKVQKLLDIRNVNGLTAELNLMVGRGARYLGNLGGLRLWAYDEIYDNAGTPTAMVPDAKVILISKDIRATVHYGAIDDVQGGRFATKMFSKTWATEDPSVQWVAVKSAPLPVIEQADGYVVATVV
jgi:hypothetical protein